MAEPSAMKCTPITSLEELLSWRPLTNKSSLRSASSKCFAADRKNGSSSFCFQPSEDKAKTLVCHDMKGGYLEDSLIDGCLNPQAYSFIQWNLIDTFVYFSHNFITIPPPCWVHAAHLHSVPILGTFITEWEDGAALCKKIFSSKDSVDVIVEQLVTLSLYHGCDGWLINIENVVEKELIGNIIYFLQHLKRELVFAGNSGIVIWYDSITKDGKLDWQNELNTFNSDFFDACDGIFLNYTWTAEHLKRSVIEAGSRTLDVYVGVDVFGRNCFGGGGFNTCSAMQVIRELGLSAAVFAPGWVYERHPIEEFSTQSTKFWFLLLPYLSIRGPTVLPIRTSFCPGYGQAEYMNGKMIKAQPWHNVCRQQMQPCIAAVGGLENADTSLVGKSDFEALKWGSTFKFGRQGQCEDDAYEGGGCLLLQSSESAIFPLFICDIPAPEKMLFAIAFKELENLVDVFRADIIYEEIGSSNMLRVTCPLKGVNEMVGGCENKEMSQVLIPFEKYGEFQLVLGKTFRSPPSSDWQTRLFQITLLNGEKNLVLRAINLISLGGMHCKIGYAGCF